MKLITLAFLMCLLVVALVSAVPADESLAGDIYGHDEQNNPTDPQSFFKLKKLKKLLLLG